MGYPVDVHPGDVTHAHGVTLAVLGDDLFRSPLYLFGRLRQIGPGLRKERDAIVD